MPQPQPFRIDGDGDDDGEGEMNAKRRGKRADVQGDQVARSDYTETPQPSLAAAMPAGTRTAMAAMRTVDGDAPEMAEA